MPAVTQLQKQFTPEKLQEIGQRLYAEKKYGESLEFLTAAIDSVPETSLSLLDNRAAIYEKLNKLQAALRDGKQMLEVDKTYVQGYLRTGKVLRMMEGKTELALKIYERGLRYASAKSEHYAALQTAHSKLTRSLAPPQAMDIFNILPLEVVEIIFNDIPFKQRCRCLRVSRHWYHFLKSWPAFWRIIDLSDAAGRPVPSKSVFSYIDNAKGGVSTAHLKHVSLQGSKILDTIFSRCKSLERLSVLSGGEISVSLERAMRRATNLKSFHTGRDVPLDGIALKKIVNSCLSLNDIHCSYVMGDAMQYEPWKRKNFENLRCYHVEFFPRVINWDPYFEDICPPARGLITLRLHAHGQAMLRLVDRDLASAMPNLEHLSFRRFSIALPFPLLHLNTVVYISVPGDLRSLALVSSLLFISSRYGSAIRLDPNTTLSKLSEFVLWEEGGEIEKQLVHRLLNLPLSEETTKLSRFEGCLPLFRTAELLQILAEPRLKELKFLILVSGQNFDDGVAEFIAESMKELEVIDVRASKITGVGVKSLVQMLPKLKRLKLSRCMGLSADAVEWARRKGVLVDYALA